MTERKKIYFASDLHLGVPDSEQSLEREKKFVRWLDQIKPSCGELHLIGDVFDFWFEYKRAVPRGYVRLLGKLAELSDEGIPIYWYIGNHDMWIFDYIPGILNCTMIYEPIIREWRGKKFYIAHGDGLGPGDKGYKFIKKVFRNKICQWCFARLHPNFGIWLANKFSATSRKSEIEKRKTFLGEENEWLIIHSKKLLEKDSFDYFIYGHRHLPLDIPIGEKARYINLGDWIEYFTYAEFDGEELFLKKFEA